MTQSKEYPDLQWVPPKAFGTGRDGKAVRYIVIHYTAGAERSTSAEDGAVYDQNRTDGVSTHYFVDSDSVVQCVLTKNRGNAARHKGNRLGIQYELCGTVQTREQWLDAASRATLKNAARQVARDCKKYGIPVRRLSVAETRSAWVDFPNGPKGIVGHVDCTYAYPEDGGDHTDPGTEFPWDVFFDMVRAELAPPTPLVEDTVTDPTASQITEAVWNKDVDPSAGVYSARGALWVTMGRTAVLNTLPASVAAIKTKLDEMVADTNVDFDALGASLVLINAKLDLLLADPTDTDPPPGDPPAVED